MVDGDLAVCKIAAYVEVTTIGVDEQGRVTCWCPQCGASAHFEADGRLVCHDWEPVQRYIDEQFPKVLAEFEAAFLGAAFRPDTTRTSGFRARPSDNRTRPCTIAASPPRH